MQARAFAPASVANVGVGFDVLGFAFQALGDVVQVKRLPKNRGKILIVPIKDFSTLPLDPMKNTATRGLVRLLSDQDLDFGFQVEIKKGIPIGSGLGGSSASAVAAATAANALLPKPLTRLDLLPYCLDGEEAASGARHRDNIVPSLLGGFQLVRSLDPLDLVALPTPTALYCVVVHPRAQVETRTARAILSPQVPLKKFVEQSANLAGFISALHTQDFALISRSLQDVLIEPQRMSLIPGFKAMQDAAIKSGSLGCSISGSGPSVFALCKGEQIARKVKLKMCAALKLAGFECTGAWMAPVHSKHSGARLL